MNTVLESRSHANDAIAILGVPFDRVTMNDALATIERMIANRNPHYIVTANVDFLTQARTDIELRRILMDAHLVLCDGTPVVWASRLLGNPLPERVAGADIVPVLLERAAENDLRVFFLGTTPESISRAIANTKQKHPRLEIEGFSPVHSHLLEMDHEEIRRRIANARPDLLFVAFGCPKQEKWMAMHYQTLGVPVAIGVGGTIDFLAGQYRRAPVWMRRTGTEWIFRLMQEPRRLFRRYARDLGVFCTSLVAQWWAMQFRLHSPAPSGPASCGTRLWARTAREGNRNFSERCIRRSWRSGGFVSILPLPRKSKNAEITGSRIKTGADWRCIQIPVSLDAVTVRTDPFLHERAIRSGEHCFLQMNKTHFIDSTGMAWLIRLQKKIRAGGKQLVLLSPHPNVTRALKRMRLENFFTTAASFEEALRLVENFAIEQHDCVQPLPQNRTVRWRGEITAANAEQVWHAMQRSMPKEEPEMFIDLSEVRFIDSSGVGLMVRAQRLAREMGIRLNFARPTSPVLNVLRLSRMEDYLLGAANPSRPNRPNAMLARV